MNVFAKSLAVLSMPMLFATAAQAEERATKEEALAFLDRASAHFQQVGADQAIKDFSTKDGKWQDRDLYIFCFNKDGVAIAHGANDKLIGRNLTDLKDADGNLFIAALVNAGFSGGGWVDYRWSNPMTKKIEPKTSFAKPFGELVCGTGIYK